MGSDDNVGSDDFRIDLLLCKSRNRLAAEYALRDISKPIGVSRDKAISSLPEESGGRGTVKAPSAAVTSP